jgi:hypothetical protein
MTNNFLGFLLDGYYGHCQHMRLAGFGQYYIPSCGYLRETALGVPPHGKKGRWPKLSRICVY